jgi:hypothetical protein
MEQINTTFMDLFPIPFQVSQLGEASRVMNFKLVNDLYKDKEVHPDSPIRTGIGGVWQSNFGLENRYESYREAANMFFGFAKPVLYRMGFRGDLDSRFSLCDFWGNINENPSAFHMPHFHGNGNTILSGVYYPSSGYISGKCISDNQDLNEKPVIEATSYPKPGSIVFMDPAVDIKRQVFCDDLVRYPYYGLEISIIPKEGVLILFPHYLTHLVTPTVTPNFTRISLAFSINFRSIDR